MSLQQKQYHEKIYENLARANQRRVHQIEKQRMLHSEMLHHYEQEICRSSIDQRRLQFRSFVADKLEEQRMLRGIDEEQFHREYLERIQKLKEEREKLTLKKIVQPYRGYSSVQQYDHSIFMERSPERSPEPEPTELIQNNKSIIQERKNGTIKQYQTTSKQILKAPINPPQHYQDDTQIKEKLFYNSRLADNLYKRWVPYDQRKEYPQKIKEQEYNKKQQDYQKINQAYQSIKNTKKPELKQKLNNSVIQEPTGRNQNNVSFFTPEEEYNEYRRKYLGKQNVKKVEDQNKETNIIVNKKPDDHIMAKQNYMMPSTSSKKRKNMGKIKNKKQSHPASILRHSRSTSSRSENEQKRKRSIEKGQNAQDPSKSVLKRIKNRLQLSTIVYQDSEHRNILHQKTHLANKYLTECKLRKDLIGKICTSKVVSQKYKNSGLQCSIKD